MASLSHVVIHPAADLGESPRWHAAERRLYWVDINRGELHRTDPETGEDEMRRFDSPVATFAFRAGGGLIVAARQGCVLIDSFDGPARAFGPQPYAGRPHHRFNDGRTDAAGRFFVGATNTAKDAADAGLWRIEPDGSGVEVAGGLLTANGAAFDASGTRFMHADTPTHALTLYDADPATGALANPRLFHQFAHGRGRPDGGSFDAEGCYWTALFDGGRVVRLDRQGHVIDARPLPCSRPTMIAFGGDDLRTAFVTTARTGLSEAELAGQPLAGAILAFRVDVPGLSEHPFGG